MSTLEKIVSEIIGKFGQTVSKSAQNLMTSFIIDYLSPIPKRSYISKFTASLIAGKMLELLKTGFINKISDITKKQLMIDENESDKIKNALVSEILKSTFQEPKTENDIKREILIKEVFLNVIDNYLKNVLDKNIKKTDKQGQLIFKFEEGKIDMGNEENIKAIKQQILDLSERFFRFRDYFGKYKIDDIIKRNQRGEYVIDLKKLVIEETNSRSANELRQFKKMIKDKTGSDFLLIESSEEMKGLGEPPEELKRHKELELTYEEYLKELQDLVDSKLITEFKLKQKIKNLNQEANKITRSVESDEEKLEIYYNYLNEKIDEYIKLHNDIEIDFVNIGKGITRGLTLTEKGDEYLYFLDGSNNIKVVKYDSKTNEIKGTPLNVGVIGDTFINPLSLKTYKIGYEKNMISYITRAEGSYTPELGQLAEKIIDNVEFPESESMSTSSEIQITKQKSNELLEQIQKYVSPETYARITQQINYIRESSGPETQENELKVYNNLLDELQTVKGKFSGNVDPIITEGEGEGGGPSGGHITQPTTHGDHILHDNKGILSFPLPTEKAEPSPPLVIEPSDDRIISLGASEKSDVLTRPVYIGLGDMGKMRIDNNNIRQTLGFSMRDDIR